MRCAGDGDMSLSAEVAAKPGGAELAEQLRRVEQARPAEIREIGQRWSKAQSKADTSGSDVSKAVGDLDGAWEGASADAFVGYMSKMTDGFDKLGSTLESASGAVNKAADVVETAKDSVNAIGERALADARKAEEACKREVAEAEDSDEEDEARQQRDQEIKQAMRQHAEEAGRKIAEADEGLRGALGELKSATENMTTFSELPKANEQRFSPDTGGKTEWEFTEPASTTPAGASTGGPDGAAGPGDSGASSAGSGGSGAGGSSGESSGGAGGGGSAGGGMGSSGGPPTSGPPPGNVEDWIKEAIRILQQNGIPVTEDNIDEIWTIIEKESGGDPHAINNWDSNAAKGTPSKGLMQCIDPTFEAHKLPGHGDIYDPVDNIIAGVRYTFDRYGGFDGHPGLESMAGGGGYQGY